MYVALVLPSISAHGSPALHLIGHYLYSASEQSGKFTPGCQQQSVPPCLANRNSPPVTSFHCCPVTCPLPPSLPWGPTWRGLAAAWYHMPYAGHWLLPSIGASGSSVLLCAVLSPQSCLTLCDPMDCSPPGSCIHGDSRGKNTGVGCHAFLQGIFPTQWWNTGLPHCRQILPWATRKALRLLCLLGILLTMPVVSLFLIVHIAPWTHGRQGMSRVVGRKLKESRELQTSWFTPDWHNSHSSRRAVASPLVADPADTVITQPHKNNLASSDIM